MADPQNYLPTRESDLVVWAANFDAKITANPTTYGLTAAQATAFTALNDAFASAHQVANNPDTRSPSNVSAKNIAKENLINGPGGIRALAKIVQAYPAINAELLTELGLTVRDAQPTPIPPPEVSPEIDFLPTGTRTIRIRLHNETTLRRSKPTGVKGANVFYFVGEAPPANIAAWTFYAGTTKTSMDINLPESVESGSTVWVTAFWFNPRQQSGPATTPVSTKVQFGGLSQAA